MPAPGAGGSSGAGGATAAAGAAAGGSGNSTSEQLPPVSGLSGVGGQGAGSSNEPSAGEAGTDAGPPPAGGICPPGPFPESPLGGSVATQQLCTGMTFTEGAVWFAERNTLFFSDFSLQGTTGRIMSFTPGGECQELIADAGTNGLAIAPDGNLLGARHVDQTFTLWNLETLEPTVFIGDNMGLAFNSPNDLVVRSDGNIYFTDPDYFRNGRPQEQPNRTYRRDPNGVISVVDDGNSPNGISLSPDESRLYVSQLGGAGSGITVFDVDASGATSNPQPFVPQGSDGMAIDCAGNLYITAGGSVQIFDPEGESLGAIPAPQAANVAFGGPERRTLFITAGPSLLSIELAIPGLPY